MGSRFSSTYNFIDGFKNQLILDVTVHPNFVVLQLCSENSSTVKNVEIRFCTCYQNGGRLPGDLAWKEVNISNLKGTNIDKGWTATKYSPFPSIRNRIYLLVDTNKKGNEANYALYKLAGSRITKSTDMIDHEYTCEIPGSKDRKASIQGLWIVNLSTDDDDDEIITR